MELSMSFYTAEDICNLTGISKSLAYQLIIKLNDELQKEGYITFRGKVNKVYFDQRVLGRKEVIRDASLQG